MVQKVILAFVLALVAVVLHEVSSKPSRKHMDKGKILKAFECY